MQELRIIQAARRPIATITPSRIEGGIINGAKADSDEFSRGFPAEPTDQTLTIAKEIARLFIERAGSIVTDMSPELIGDLVWQHLNLTGVGFGDSGLNTPGAAELEIVMDQLSMHPENGILVGYAVTLDCFEEGDKQWFEIHLTQRTAEGSFMFTNAERYTPDGWVGDCEEYHWVKFSSS